jgi:hypothetical protein
LDGWENFRSYHSARTSQRMLAILFICRISLIVADLSQKVHRNPPSASQRVRNARPLLSSLRSARNQPFAGALPSPQARRTKVRSIGTVFRATSNLN